MKYTIPVTTEVHESVRQHMQAAGFATYQEFFEAAITCSMGYFCILKGSYLSRGKDILTNDETDKPRNKRFYFRSNEEQERYLRRLNSDFLISRAQLIRVCLKFFCERLDSLL